MVLQFFDNDGCPILFNESYIDGVQEADIYLEPVSVSLYENFNIYLLERYDDEDIHDAKYRFPILDSRERYLFRWNCEDDEIPEYFFYNIEKNASDNNYYIDKQNNIKLFEYVNRNIRSPFQLNVGFSPTEEVSYRKSLLVIREYLNDDNEIDQTLEFRINFYGEGIEEDPRFKIQLENFGIRLNKTDALAIKDYNVSEAYPDWELVNNVRKHLILEKEELVPYLGTYRCLKNIISLFGYGDSIDVREYYKNINPNSEYFGKYSIVSIADFLDNGKVDSMNLVDRNSRVKDNSDFQKCGMLALAYEFNKKSGKYDDNGIPIMENNSEFTKNEMFFKLHKLKNILERDYLPVNVFICDVIGEWSYYVSFTKYVWADNLEITTLNLTEKIKIETFPKEISNHMYDVSMLHAKRFLEPSDSELPDYVATDYYKVSPMYESYVNDVIDMPIKSVNDTLVPESPVIDYITTDNFNTGELSMYRNQHGVPNSPAYLKDDMIDSLCESIEKFYSEYQSKGFDQIYDKQYDYVENYNNHIGFPIIFSVILEKLKIEDLKFTRFCDYGTPSLNSPEDDDTSRVSWKDLYYRNFVDVEWHVEYNTPVDRKNNIYKFDYIGSIKKADRLPQILPYTGTYDVSVKVRNSYGLVSYSYKDKFVVVDNMVPQVVAMYPGDDVFKFDVNSLKYIKLQDFGSTTPLNPRVNVLDNITESDVVIDQNLISSSEIVSYKNDTEVYNFSSKKWEAISNTSDQNADNFGFGDFKALKLSDFKGATINDLFHVRPIDCVMSDDVLYGFWMAGVKAGCKLYYRFFRDGRRDYYEIPNKGDLASLCKYLNDGAEGTLPRELKMFTYYPIIANKLDAETYEGVREGDKVIIAEARHFSRHCAFKLEYEDSKGGKTFFGPKYTFSKPRYGLDRTIYKYENEFDVDSELLSTAIEKNDIFKNPDDVFTNDYLMDAGFEYSNSVIENDKKYGYIPMLYDTNMLNANTCKLHTHSFCVPLFKRVVFFVNNIVGKDVTTMEWTLRDIYGNPVIKVRNNPYFIYNFNETGNYELDVEFRDINGNYYSKKLVKFINVVNREDYIDSVNYKLMEKSNK